MVIAALLFLAGVIVEFYAIHAAPFGYQDEEGFHTGMERSRRNLARPDTRTS